MLPENLGSIGVTGDCKIGPVLHTPGKEKLTAGSIEEDVIKLCVDHDPDEGSLSRCIRG